MSDSVTQVYMMPRTDFVLTGGEIAMSYYTDFYWQIDLKRQPRA